MKKIVIGSLLVSFVGCSSGGTETDNPASIVKDFTSSDCKSRGGQDGALTLASELAGLACVEWEVEGAGQLRLLLHNFSEACAEGYAGDAALTEDGLDLRVYQTTCDVLKCGSCLYDFDYRLAGVATDAPLQLRLGWARCAAQATTWNDALTLPLDEAPSGVVCKSAALFSLRTYASSHASCGGRNMPCGDCADDRSTCAEGLVCTTYTQDDARCLQACETDEECIANLRCDEGLCRAADSF